MRPLVGTLLAIGLFLPLALRAADPPADPDAEERQAWQETLRQARADLASARARYTAADLAYKRMRHRDRDRGGKKAAILAEREAAQGELEAAEARLEALPEEARRAGVPPGWLRFELEEEPAALDP
jgi:hypothetical protein